MWVVRVVVFKELSSNTRNTISKETFETIFLGHMLFVFQLHTKTQMSSHTVQRMHGRAATTTTLARNLGKKM